MVTDDQLSGVRLRSRALIRRDAVVVAPLLMARHGVLDDIGVNVADHPLGIGRQIEANASALMAINADLTAEDTALAVVSAPAGVGSRGWPL